MDVLCILDFWFEYLVGYLFVLYYVDVMVGDI